MGQEFELEEEDNDQDDDVEECDDEDVLEFFISSNITIKANKKINCNNNSNYDFIDKETEKHVNPYENFCHGNSTNSENSINFVVEMGFTVEEATIAYTAVGSDPELMLQYLYSLQHY